MLASGRGVMITGGEVLNSLAKTKIQRKKYFLFCLRGLALRRSLENYLQADSRLIKINLRYIEEVKIEIYFKDMQNVQSNINDSTTTTFSF